MGRVAFVAVDHACVGRLDPLGVGAGDECRELLRLRVAAVLFVGVGCLVRVGLSEAVVDERLTCRVTGWWMGGWLVVASLLGDDCCR